MLVHQMSFDINSTERACRTNRFAHAATDATSCVDDGYFRRIIVSRVFYHHLDSSVRTVACTVSTGNTIGIN